MNYYQDNLTTSDRVYFSVEAEDGERAIEILQNASIPVNGAYESPVQILAHEKIEERDIEDDDVKQNAIEELNEKMTDIINDSWSDIIASIECVQEYENPSDGMIDDNIVYGD